MNTRNRSDHQPLAEPIAALVDAMLDQYVDRREDAANVAEGHRRRRDAHRADDAELHSAYLAALHQEHSGAIACELAVRDVEEWFERADARSCLASRAPAPVFSRIRIELDRRGRAAVRK